MPFYSLAAHSNAPNETTLNQQSRDEHSINKQICLNSVGSRCVCVCASHDNIENHWPKYLQTWLFSLHFLRWNSVNWYGCRSLFRRLFTFIRLLNWLRLENRGHTKPNGCMHLPIDECWFDDIIEYTQTHTHAPTVELAQDKERWQESEKRKYRWNIRHSIHWPWHLLAHCFQFISHPSFGGG